MEILNYKNENIGGKYFKNMRKNQFLKVKNSLIELEKDFVELKNREVKIKRETEEIFLKLIMVSIDDMDKFEQKEMKEIRSINYTWYDYLMKYIPESKKMCRWFKL